MSKKIPVSHHDLQGYTRLLTDATIGITDVVETMHRRILYPPFLPATPIQDLIAGVCGVGYKSFRLATKIIGGGLDRAFGIWPGSANEIATTEQRESFLAVLNGVVGDHLVKSKNPLAIDMNFHYQGQPIPLNAERIKTLYPQLSGKILLLVHGSCMNDLQWNQEGYDHGLALAETLNYCPVYLQYNSGQHISTNGQELSVLLEELCKEWPVPIEQLDIVAHSMGGLVSRSAIYYGKKEKRKWTKQLQKICFLGTPHHGAPLERLGNYVDLLLEAIPYAKPFARLGKIRSAGVTDLRYGNVVAKDWEGKDRFAWRRDERQFIPLPKEIAAYNLAACLTKEGARSAKRLLGDGLVTLDSALGRHKKKEIDLAFPIAHNWISYESNHVDLLKKQEVLERLVFCLEKPI